MNVYAAGDSAAAQKTPEAIKEAGSKIASAVVEAGENLSRARIPTHTPITTAMHLQQIFSSAYARKNWSAQDLARLNVVAQP